jgi:protein-disulfide isomerase
MTPPTPAGSQPGKKDRREQAREKARVEREAEKRRQRRTRIFVQGGVGIVVLAIIAVVAIVIVNVNTNKPGGAGPLNMASGGIVISGSSLKALPTKALKSGEAPIATDTKKLEGVAHIVTYIDYQCPYCDQFETTNESQISSLVKAGEATVEIHPIAILDSSSLGNKYSTRAANAAACVANYDPNDFYAVNTALYANQPAENTNGMNDTKLLSILKKGGASSSKITSCVTSQRFSSFVTAQTTRVTGGDFNGTGPKGAKFQGTPTVFVNGKQYSGSLTDASAFATFLEQSAS